MTVGYHPEEFNEITVLMRWRGTVLPMVLCRPAVWLLLSAHVVFLYLHLFHEEVKMPPMPWKLVGVPTSLLTFFLVFYSGNCFTRYYKFYSHCMGMSGCVMTYIGLLRIHFPTATSDELYNLCRYPMASVIVLYTKLGASDGGKLITLGEWAKLRATGLVAEKEISIIKAFRGFRPFLLQVWGLQALDNYLRANKDKAPHATFGPFAAQMLALRGHCDDMLATMEQPVPFPYYHTLTLMLSLNLLLMAYAMIEFETVMTIPCFFTISLICLGLKETAVSLSDPFGGDDVDLPTESFKEQMMANALAIISPTIEFSKVSMPLVTGNKAALATAKAL